MIRKMIPVGEENHAHLTNMVREEIVRRKGRTATFDEIITHLLKNQIPADVATKVQEIARIDKRTMSALIDMWSDNHLATLGTLKAKK